MKIVLRTIAVVTGLVVVLTVPLILRFALSGSLAALGQSGVLGLMTFCAWFVILALGPIAAVQLWRLRRIALFATALLGSVAGIYYLVGLLLRIPGTPAGPIVMRVLANGGLVVLLLSSAARRACAQGR